MKVSARPLPEETDPPPAWENIGFRLMMGLGAGLLIYLLGFAALITFPQLSRAVRMVGISPETLEMIYFPVIWFLE